jgi:RHH-type proline utilization regulon transcriptional repressor/proline dehydrogenase/delta 1-pyrroline-5-carboxylate dehydrogenase
MSANQQLQLPKLVKKAFTVGSITHYVSTHEFYSHYWENEQIRKQLLEEFYRISMFLEQLPDQMWFRQEINIENHYCCVHFSKQSKTFYLTSLRGQFECFLEKLARLKQGEPSPETQTFLDWLQILKQEIDHPTLPIIHYITYKNQLASFWPQLRLGQKKDIINLEEQINQETERIKDQLEENLGEYRESLFEKISNFGLNIVAQYSLVRIHLLKFLAILPCLDHDRSGTEVKRILLESIDHLLEDQSKLKAAKNKKERLPRWMSIGSYGAKLLFSILPAKQGVALIRWSVKQMASRFIVGESFDSIQQIISELQANNREITIDQLGELVVSGIEAEKYLEKVLKSIDFLNSIYNKSEKNQANIAKAHVSIKVSALTGQFVPEDFEATYEQVSPRLARLFKAAMRSGVFVHIDAEHYTYRDTVFKIMAKVLEEHSEFEQWDGVGIVVQSYLKDSWYHLKQVLDFCGKRKQLMPIRIVKGAYWDEETVKAEANNQESPQFLNKVETDIHFRQLIYEIIDHPYAQLVLASHNSEDHCWAEALRNVCFEDSHPIEHQFLHMTYEGLSMASAKMGWATRNYVPMGDLLVGMAYLVRRIMENSSQVGFLAKMRLGRGQKESVTPMSEKLESLTDLGEYRYEKNISSLSADFFNHPPLKTHLDQPLEKMSSQFNRAESEVFKEYQSGELNVYNPSTGLLLAKVSLTTKDQLEKQLDQLETDWEGSLWAYSPAYRMHTLAKAALLMSQKRDLLAGVIIAESGKTFGEALADVDEAIDFINFYNSEQLKLEQHSPGKWGGQGIVAAICPWNFPLAIPCGMVTSALVTGNRVVVKPAEQTPVIALEWVKILRQVGIDESVLAVVTGPGEAFDAYWSSDRIQNIVFTGSKNVGTYLYGKNKLSTVMNPINGQIRPKQVVSEMGGKNAIVVTNNCELDETIAGIIYAAFAHSGQKCSACSRVIIDQRIKTVFLERFIEAVDDIFIGTASKLSTLVNPLISLEEKQRVLDQINLIKQEAEEFGGKVLVDLSGASCNQGYVVGPVVVELPSERAVCSESFARKELFAPIVHIIGFNDLDEAIDIVNSTEYALTGGVYSQSQNDIDYLVKRMNAGNLYINRPNTGARVAIEPFGGHKLSGTGPKAGGRDYLFAFRDKIHQTNPGFGSGQDLEGKENRFEIASEYYPHLAPSTSIDWTRSIQLINDLLDSKLIKVGELVDANIQKMLFELKKLFLDEIKHRENNLKIPGQISQNDFLSGIKQIAIISDRTKLNLETGFYLLSCAALEIPAMIACRNQDSYQYWMNLVGQLWQAGFSRNRIDVCQGGDRVLDRLLKDQVNEAIIIDENQLDQAIVTQLEGQLVTEQGLKRLIWCSHGQELLTEELWYRLQQLVYTRSLSINIMRHGAPLELQVGE